ncbi:MAG: hypothetical protein U0840_00415 [Gemmataceae bacterium]
MPSASSHDRPMRPATELTRQLPLSIAGRRLLTPALSPAQYLKALVDQGEYVDALRLMAVALLPRESVWWACLCTRHTLGVRQPASPEEEQALHAAVAWILQPDATNRDAAGQAGAAAGSKTAAGCAALAASHGGTAEGTVDPVPPVPRMVSKLVSAAVLLAAVAGKPEDLDLNYRQFIALGIDVDNHQ